MKQRHKFSLGYSLVVFFTIIMLESLFFTGTAVREIPYSRFRELLKADRIQSVIVKSNLMSRSELLGKIKGLLGGRAAEELVFGEVSTGASNDLEKVAEIVQSMITVYGMSTHMPNLSLVEKERDPFLGQGAMVRRRSEKLEESIDRETREIIDACYQEALRVLSDHRKELDRMVQLLLEKEKIDAEEIQAILGPRQLPGNTPEHDHPQMAVGS